MSPFHCQVWSAFASSALLPTFRRFFDKADVDGFNFLHDPRTVSSPCSTGLWPIVRNDHTTGYVQPLVLATTWRVRGRQPTGTAARRLMRRPRVSTN